MVHLCLVFRLAICGEPLDCLSRPPTCASQLLRLRPGIWSQAKDTDESALESTLNLAESPEVARSSMRLRKGKRQSAPEQRFLPQIIFERGPAQWPTEKKTGTTKLPADKKPLRRQFSAILDFPQFGIGSASVDSREKKGSRSHQETQNLLSVVCSQSAFCESSSENINRTTINSP